METRTMICIGCPMGCQMEVSIGEDAGICVSGNTCRRGEIYARKEVGNPTRIVTSTVAVEGGKAAAVSVKTKEDVPKDKIFEVMGCLKGLKVQAPVRIGDVIVKDVAGTGVDIVATKNISAS
ncbi:DUF1667 domain-containing protein [Lachnospiraceae bacterium 29-84]